MQKLYIVMQRTPIRYDKRCLTSPSIILKKSAEVLEDKLQLGGDLTRLLDNTADEVYISRFENWNVVRAYNIHSDSVSHANYLTHKLYVGGSGQHRKPIIGDAILDIIRYMKSVDIVAIYKLAVLMYNCYVGQSQAASKLFCLFGGGEREAIPNSDWIRNFKIRLGSDQIQHYLNFINAVKESFLVKVTMSLDEAYRREPARAYSLMRDIVHQSIGSLSISTNRELCKCLLKLHMAFVKGDVSSSSFTATAFAYAVNAAFVSDAIDSMVKIAEVEYTNEAVATNVPVAVPAEAETTTQLINELVSLPIELSSIALHIPPAAPVVTEAVPATPVTVTEVSAPVAALEASEQAQRRSDPTVVLTGFGTGSSNT